MFQWLESWFEEPMRLKRSMDAAMVRWQRERQAAASRLREQRRYVCPRLERLEDLVLLNSDVLVWNPPAGGDNNASNGANWWDLSLGETWNMANGGQDVPPTLSNTIWLDNSLGDHGQNAPIIWDKNLEPNQQGQQPTYFGVSNILVKNGYDAQQTVNDGVSVESALGIGVSGLGSDVNIKFGTGSSFWQTGGNDVWLNFNLTSPVAQPDKFNGFGISGGSLTISANPGLTETSQVGIEAYQYAGIYMGNQQTGALSTLTLQNGTGYIGAYGGSVLMYGSVGAGATSTIVQGDGAGNSAQGSEEIVAQTTNGYVGSVGYQGSGVNAGNPPVDTLKVPVWANGGSFMVNGGGGGSTKGSTLQIQGQTNDTNNKNVYANQNSNGTVGVVLLQGNATLNTNSQDMEIGNGGYLKTYDTTACTVVDNNLMVDSGGAITVYYSTGGLNGFQFGTLNIQGNLQMAGTYNATIGSTSQGWAGTMLNVSGQENWNAATDGLFVHDLSSTFPGQLSSVSVGTYGSVTGKIGNVSGDTQGMPALHWYYSFSSGNLDVWGSNEYGG